jgi:hypothetical protein
MTYTEATNLESSVALAKEDARGAKLEQEVKRRLKL